jgi:hypothetical protein
VSSSTSVAITILRNTIINMRLLVRENSFTHIIRVLLVLTDRSNLAQSIYIIGYYWIEAHLDVQAERLEISVLSEHSVNIQWTFSEHSVNIKWTFGEYIFSEHLVNIQWKSARTWTSRLSALRLVHLVNT